MTIDKYTIRS
jgi:hypothetical protein